MSEQATSSKQPIPGFRLVNKLGAGGMGAVYKAVQLSLDREVAIKVMPFKLAGNPEFKERFFREARAAGRLNHPNIVQGIDAGEAGKYCWIAMELVNGRAVSDHLQEKGRFSEEEALRIITDIARGLEHAAKADIVHRDVKPENFLLAPDGTAKLCDLGIAKAPTDAGLTQDGRAVGTPRYIAPEQARGEHDIDSRADIYSLGASWYHMLCGEPPFDGDTAAVVMTKHITEAPPPLARRVQGVSPHTVKVIEKMMAKEIGKRYQTFEELLVDLQALAEGQAPPGVSAPPRSQRKKRASGRSGPRPAPRKRGGRAAARSKSSAVPLLVAGGAVLLIVLIIAVVATGGGNGNGGPEPPDRRPPPPEPPPSGPVASPPPEPDEPAPAKPAGPADRQEAAAARAWRAMQDDLKRLPQALHADRYEEFVRLYEGTSYGKRAAEELRRLDEAAEEFLMTQAKQAYDRFQAMADESARERLEAAEEFLRLYPAAEPYSGRVRRQLEALQQAIERAEERRKTYVGLSPQYPEQALRDLRLVVEGEENATVDDIRPFLEHRQKELRALAVRAMAQMDREAGFEAAAAALQDRNEDARLAAVQVLGAYPTEEARALLQRAAEEDLSPRVRAEAREALAD